MLHQAKKILKSVFGYDAFYPIQEKIISAVLNKNDTLVIMPTGGGKSICYQIPALLHTGLTIVISPLISLMKNQVEELKELGVKAELLNSSLSYAEYLDNKRKVITNQIKLLYIAPETLMKPDILQMLSSVQVNYLAIDEAHCISAWGHDFRPEYRQLAKIRKYLPNTTCIALTATATKKIREDIQKNLNFSNSKEFIASFNRKNLFLQVIPKRDPFNQTINFLKKYSNQSGIIYCFTRKQVEILSESLDKSGYSVRPYHAGLTNKERTKNQELFINDDIQIIVATIAFGMGINKPNVRFVIHYDLPKNIESYYQEIGRAGRDGLPASCLLLYNFGDINKIRYIIDQKTDKLQKQIAAVHLKEMIKYAESSKCRRDILMTYFEERYITDNCTMCDNCNPVIEKNQIDISKQAKLFFECMRITNQYFGADHIINILRGSNSKKIKKFEHHLLPIYGKGVNHTKEEWIQLKDQFIKKGFIRKDIDFFGVLKLTKTSFEVLKDNLSVKGVLEKSEEPIKQKDVSLNDYDKILFELLRKKRKELADKENVPPYIIFSDKTLIEIAKYYPQSKTSLVNIFGFGENKLEKYGELFLEIIIFYCKKNNFLDKTGNKIKLNQFNQKFSTLSKPKPRYETVGEMYNNGDTIEKLTSDFNVKQNTITDNLYKYVKEGNKIRLNGLFSLIKVPTSKHDAINKTFETIGTEYLKPVFESLNGTISYDDLKIFRLYYLNKNTC